MTTQDKASYIVRRLLATQASLLRMPDWDIEDLSELSPNLRQYILKQIAAKAELRRRIDFARTLAGAEPF